MCGFTLHSAVMPRPKCPSRLSRTLALLLPLKCKARSLASALPGLVLVQEPKLLQVVEKCSESELKVEAPRQGSKQTAVFERVDIGRSRRGGFATILSCGPLQVTRGGKLKARKGVNVPDVEINCAALTAKDIEDRSRATCAQAT